MNTLTKGELTRLKILRKVNDLFNERGVDHTLAQISRSIGMGKSLITNYFPKKDDLLVSLLKEYEKERTAWATKFLSEGDILDFLRFIPYLHGHLVLMFRYRGVIPYALINRDLEGNLAEYMRTNYGRNKEHIYLRMKTFVSGGLLVEDILEEDAFEAFIWQYLCVTSNWIVMYNILDADKEFENVNIRYIRNILYCLQPYLTGKGKENLAAAFSQLEKAG